MSNYALQNEVNSLERELSQVQSLNNQLHSELNTVENGARRAHNELESFNSQIQNNLEHAENTMRLSHQTVIDAFELQGEIEKLYIRFKNIELANKKIRACNNKKYYDFSNYRTVRKIVRGIMDNLDINMVSDKVITKSVEIQHLQTPDYWLTCALISVMAWKNNDKELADRAMARAVKINKKQSTVFYMLFNLRMEREEAALKWFNIYQEFDLKGSDQRTFLMLFSLVCKTISDSADERVRIEVLSFINKVIENNAKSSGFSENDILSFITLQYNKMKPNDQFGYMMLKKYCTRFDELASILISAQNNINILEFVLQINNVTMEQHNSFLKGYIDELIAEPNQIEKDVYDEIIYNELIIKAEGDIETAKAQNTEIISNIAKDLDLISEMISWIYEKDSSEVNGQIRKNMFTLTKPYQGKAITQYVDAYRKRRQTILPIKINDFIEDIDFDNEEEAMSKIRKYYDDLRDVAILNIKNRRAFFGIGVGTVALAGAFFVGWGLLCITAAGLGYGAFVFLSNKTQKRQFELQHEEHIRIACDIMKDTFLEFKQYNVELEEYDSYYDQIVRVMDGELIQLPNTRKTADNALMACAYESRDRYIAVIQNETVMQAAKEPEIEVILETESKAETVPEPELEIMCKTMANTGLVPEAVIKPQTATKDEQESLIKIESSVVFAQEPIDLTVSTLVEDSSTLLRVRKYKKYIMIAAVILMLIITVIVAKQIGNHFTVIGDSSMIATDTLKSYNITYELSIASDENIKNSYFSNYRSTDGDISLPNPSRSGYEFQGWFKSSDFSEDTLVESIAIPTGSTGDKIFYAKWQKIPDDIALYSIKYELNGGTNNGNNLGFYKSSDPDVVLNAPTRSGYDFQGWFGSSDFSESTKVVAVAIPNGSFGDKTFYAKWMKRASTPAIIKTDSSSSNNNQLIITVDE